MIRQAVIISGKGGTGKTSLTAALAGLLPDVVLADCDVDAADLHLVLTPRILETRDFVSGEEPVLEADACTGCGLCAEHCRYHAIAMDDAGKAAISLEACEGCGACAFVCPTGAVAMRPRTCGVQHRSETRFGPMHHAALFPAEENSGKLVTSVRQAAKEDAEARGARLVLVDGAPGVGCPVIASLTDTDLALAVTEPTRSALHDLGRVLDLAKHFRIPAAAVLNKCGLAPEVEDEVRDLCRQRKVPLLGEIPYDDAVTRAQLARLTVAEHDPDGLGRLFEKLGERLLEYMNNNGQQE